jgi:hypothetical protein
VKHKILSTLGFKNPKLNKKFRKESMISSLPIEFEPVHYSRVERFFKNVKFPKKELPMGFWPLFSSNGNIGKL